jgi:tetratricopeptide (TPR) repeat protein
VLARLADALLYDHDWKRTDELSAAAVETARATGDDVALMRALAARLLALMRPATLDERLRLADELTRLATTSGDPDRESEALGWQIAHALEQGDGPRVDAHVQRFAKIAETARQPHMLWGARLHAAMRALLVGPLDEAEQLAHDALAVAQGVVPLSAAMFAVQIMAVRREQGRLAEVEPGLRAFVQTFPAVRAWRATWAGLLLEIGAEREARAELERIAREDFLVDADDYEWPAAMTMLGEAYAYIGDRDRCAVLYERLLPYADRTVVAAIGAVCGGPIARHLGLMAQAIGDADAAARHFEHALAVRDRLGARTYAARTRLEFGRLLLQHGQADAAAALLRRAVEEADALGMAIADQARALLAEHDRPRGHTELVFRRAGEVWEVGDALTPVRLRDAKGLRYVAELLARPGVDVAAADLAGVAGNLGDAGPALDASAKDAYRRRLEDLRSEQEDAERWNDPERAARARAELDAIGAELASAVGLGGRDRRAASSAERARISVTKAIRTAVKRIAGHDPQLAELLDRSIKTGTFCRYEPPGRESVTWQLTM